MLAAKGSESILLPLRQAASGESIAQLLHCGVEGSLFSDRPGMAILRKPSPQCLVGLIWGVAGLFVSGLICIQGV